MRLLLCFLLPSLGLGFVDVDDHNARFVTRYNARQFQKIQEFLIDPSTNNSYFAVNTNLYMGDPAFGPDVYIAIRDRLYFNYGNMTNIWCIVEYTDPPVDLHTYNVCEVNFKSGVVLKFVTSIKTIGTTPSGVPDNRYWFMSFSDPPPPPCTSR